MAFEGHAYCLFAAHVQSFVPKPSDFHLIGIFKRVVCYLALGLYSDDNVH